MANEKNNINELVSDDDPTAELEVAKIREEHALESELATYDSKDDRRSDSNLQLALRERDRTIAQLQFDLEHLNAKWLGLEAESHARENQHDASLAEQASLQDALSRKEKLIKKRDRKIKLLKSEIRQREKEHHALLVDTDDLRRKLASQSNPQVAESAGSEVTDQRDTNDLLRQVERSDDYADTLRRQLQNALRSSARATEERDNIAAKIQDVSERLDAANSALEEALAHSSELESTLGDIEECHAAEIRTLRFELGEAQETMAESEEITGRLTSDLIDAHGHKNLLEETLAEVEESAKKRVDSLEKEIARLGRENAEYEQKLATKSEAISILLAEVAKKREQLESIDEIEDVIYDIDDRMEDLDAKRRSATERMTRVLVGTVDGQVLRFPLFKDKLTIGRTDDNDIQLKAAHISRRHAVLQTDRESTRVIDWGSKNGVFVNSERVKEHFLKHGDIVMIGNARFRYEERRKREV